MSLHKPQNQMMVWWQQHNLFPLIALIITGASLASVWSNKVALLDQRVTYIQSEVDACVQNVNQTRDNLENLKLQVIDLAGRTSVNSSQIPRANTPAAATK